MIILTFLLPLQKRNNIYQKKKEGKKEIKRGEGFYLLPDCNDINFALSGVIFTVTWVRLLLSFKFTLWEKKKHTHKAGLFKTEVGESKCVCTLCLKAQACYKHVTKATKALAQPVTGEDNGVYRVL